MNYKIANLIEYQKRGVVEVEEFKYNHKTNTLTAFYDLKLKNPNELDFFLAYVTLCIPSAMLARVVRKVTEKKRNPFRKLFNGTLF